MVTARPEVLALEPVAHGGPNYSELAKFGLQPQDIRDFSASCAPLGPSPTLRAALANAAIERYPDTEGTRVREALAARLGITPEHIILGNGSVELMWLISLAYVRPGDRVVIVGPTFGEYARPARIMGATIVMVDARPNDDFAPPVDEVLATIARERPRLVWVCQPNNPTGTYLSRKIVRRIIQGMGTNGLLILDEAYIAFVPRAWSSIPLTDGPVIILRSMTKDLAMPGLRLGYAVASPDCISVLRRVRPPWNTNAAAQAAALAGLADRDYERYNREVARQESIYLQEGLQALGLRVIPSYAHFFLVEVGDAPAFRRALLARGMSVRDCTSFGLPTFVRIAPRTHADNQALLHAVEQILRDGYHDPAHLRSSRRDRVE